MQEVYIKSNPLIRSVVHQSLQTAIRNIGLPEFPRETFLAEIAPYVRTSDSLFAEHEKSLDKLWNAVLRGEIVVTEAAGETAIFYVKAVVDRRVMDVRLTCHNQVWHVDAVVSMYEQSIIRWNGLLRVAFAVSVILAGMIGYAVHPSAVEPAAQSQTQGAATSIKHLTNQTVTAVEKNQSQTGTSQNQTTGFKTSAPVAASQPQTLTFQLKPGMPLHQLSVFLHAHNLIHEAAVKFDMVLKKARVDRTVLPGSYTFHQGMTQAQIVNALKAGPSH